MKVDGQRVPVAVLGNVGVHDEILNVDLAEGLDRARDSPQQRWHITLALASGVGLTEVLYGP